MICPFCLGENDLVLDRCSHPQCKLAFPPAYLQLHQDRRGSEPIILSIVGFSGHGKTVYLAALFDTLDHVLPQSWPGFSRRALDQETLSYVDDGSRRLRQGTLPESTRLNFPKPSIHRLSGIPQYGDRTLLLYDPPGEAFNQDEGIGQYASFVKRSNCVLFLISLSNLEPPAADGMFKLLNTYILGMSRLGVPAQNQHLVVVYTKADETIESLASPKLNMYLREQGLDSLTNLQEYSKGMGQISTLLQDMTSSHLGAHAFVNEAKRYFKTVNYTAVSSLGTSPRNGALEETISPRRVIDPFLWVMAKHAVIKEQSSTVPRSPGDPPPPSGKSAARPLAWLIAAIILLVTVGVIFSFRSTSSKPTPQPTANLVGEWRITNTIEQSSYSPYQGLRLGYRIFLQQNGNAVQGAGEKYSENGNDIPPTAHTPIQIKGTLNGSDLNATFVEEGRRRTTTGSFTWQVIENGKRLQGSFIHTAASSSGTSTGEKVQ